MDWIESNKLPLGEWFETHLEIASMAAGKSGFAPTVTWALKGVFDFIYVSLSTPDPLIIVLIAGSMIWTLTRRYVFAVFVAGSLILTLNLGFWKLAMLTVSFVVCALCTSCLVGIPLALLLSCFRRSANFFRPILTIAPFALYLSILKPIVSIFGTGNAPGIVAASLVAMCPIMLATDNVVDGESRTVHRAGGWRRILDDIRVPGGRIRRAIKMAAYWSLAMSTMVSIISAQGLGSVVLVALQYSDVDRGFEAAIVLLLLAVKIEILCSGNRKAKAEPASEPASPSEKRATPVPEPSDPG